MFAALRIAALFALAATVCVTPSAGQPPASPRVAEVAPAPRAVGAAPPPAGHAEAAALAKEAYLMPPKEIADAVLAARGENTLYTNLGPDGTKFLVQKRDGLPSLERLGCPCVHLAEMAFDPVACRARDLWVNSSDALSFFFPQSNRTVAVKATAGARFASPVWSPDGKQLAFLALTPDATHLRVADTDTGASRQVTAIPVLATLATAPQWSKDGKSLTVVLLPNEGKNPVPKLGVATEPKVRIARDGKDPSRTYRYLLDSPYQMQLLEHLLTGQLAVVNVASGAVKNVGTPAMIRSFSAAPGETHFRVSTVKKPFSYYAPFQRFGTLEDIWDAAGKSLVTIADRSLRESEPAPPPLPTVPTGQTVPTGPKGGTTKGKGKGTDPMAPAPMPAPQPPVNPDDPPANPFAEPVDPDAKREITWRPDGKGLSFLQTEPAKKDEPKKEPAPMPKKAGEDEQQPKDEPKKDEPKKDAPAVRKDRLMLWVPPFGKDDTKLVYESATGITGVQYSADAKWAFVSQAVDGQRQITAIDVADPKATFAVYRGGTAAEPKKKAKEDDADDEQQPGGGRFGGAAPSGLLTKTAGGQSVVRVSSAGAVYVSGSERAKGAEPGGFAKPFIDAVEIKTGKKTRLFEGKGDTFETIDAVNGDDVKTVFTTRQNTKVVPDSFTTELPGGKSTKLTNNVDKTAWFHDLKVERFKVTRVDGFKFNVKVTTSPKATGKLPALFWIYPREYADQAAYDRGSGGPGGAGGTLPGRFASPAPRAVAILTLAGYAVVEPDVPIVGPVGKMNDNYVPDLRNSLWAAIDECDKRGLIDRDRLACGGHSYGAFSTANALAHTPFFKAGIAGDGCYNRTLTSMSFQSERRHLWDARETYLEMSPLLWANRVNGALLMYHGMEDANVGTNPINSEALFAALDGLGKDAALYMYPYEGHGPIARETNLDLWARWVAWLDKYVKNPKK